MLDVLVLARSHIPFLAKLIELERTSACFDFVKFTKKRVRWGWRGEGHFDLAQ